VPSGSSERRLTARTLLRLRTDQRNLRTATERPDEPGWAHPPQAAAGIAAAYTDVLTEASSALPATGQTSSALRAARQQPSRFGASILTQRTRVTHRHAKSGPLDARGNGSRLHAGREPGQSKGARYRPRPGPGAGFFHDFPQRPSGNENRYPGCPGLAATAVELDRQFRTSSSQARRESG